MTVGALLLFASVWLWNNFSIPFPIPAVEPRPFNEMQWKSWTKDNIMQSKDIRRVYLRRDMLDDLLKKRDFRGWTTTELVDLLGQSNPEFCPDEWDVAYLLGVDWVDYVVLVFRLDENDRVKNYRVNMY